MVRRGWAWGGQHEYGTFPDGRAEGRRRAVLDRQAGRARLCQGPAELTKDKWHAHAEIPSPVPEGSKLWVEIEAAGGEIVVAGFDPGMN
ncbi:MAG: hypothetical protein KIS87_11210 [Phycisphaeraceae bacterium]|nr:hypothetical protein [Phycisphaeraceae bacterium]